MKTFGLTEKHLEALMKTIGLTALAVLLLSGCAGSGLKLEKAAISEPEQNWQAKAVEVPADLKDLRILSVAVIAIDPIWMADGMGYFGAEGDFITRDAWRMLIFRTSGVVESSAVINNRWTTLFGLLPNISVDEARRTPVLVVSGSGASVMTARGVILGPLSQDPAKRE
ncbi:MAG: hypothetical protein MN733_14590, partial [Nitrososphaera sp.]|nr:hypothetical protein [Nitrososphaera sp.]